MIDAISVIGSIASILGAIWAWKEAKKSKTSAELAQRIKDQLIGHRKTSELAELQALLSTAQKKFTKYGASNPKALAGIDHHADSESLLSFMHTLKSYNEYFEGEHENVADKFYDDIEKTLQLFRTSSSINNITEHGNSILNKLANFSPILKREFTSKKESVVTGA